MQSWNKVSGSGISQVRNEWVGLVMAQYWVSQVLSSLGSWYNWNIDRVWHRKLWIKSCYNLKNFCEWCWFFVCDLLSPNCADTSKPKFVNTLRPKCVESSFNQYV